MAPRVTFISAFFSCELRLNTFIAATLKIDDIVAIEMKEEKSQNAIRAGLHMTLACQRCVGNTR
jgi:hypothetical protein